MFNTTNLNYEEIIKSLNIKNKRLILELELENDDRSLLELLHNTSQIVEERSENDTESAANNPNSRAQNRTIEHNTPVIMEQNQAGPRPVKPRLIPDELSEGDSKSTPSRRAKMQETRKMFESPLGYGKGVKSVSPEHPRRRAVDESMREYGNKRESQRDSEMSRREVLITDQDLPKKTETSVSNNLSVYQNQFFGRRIRKESGNSNKSNREVNGYGNESSGVKSGERTDTQETFQKSSKPSQFVAYSKTSDRTERLSNKNSDNKQRIESASSVIAKETTERLSNKNNSQRRVARGSTKREEIPATKRKSAVRTNTEEDKKSEALELPSSTKRTQESRKEKKEEVKSEIKVSTKSSRRESEPKSKKLQSQKSQSEEYADDFEEMDFDDDTEF